MKIKITVPLNIREFIRDYRLPLAATLAFVFIVLFLFIGRLRERGELGQALAVNKSGNGDYARLLSNDKRDDFVTRDVTADDNAVTLSDNKQTTVIASPVTSSSTSSSTTSTSTAGSSVPSGGSTAAGSTVPTVPKPFAASITDFQQDKSPSLQCPNGLLSNINKCSKIYSFAASVQTTNGPGTVNYDWRYSVSGSSNSSFVAAGGTNVTTLHNQLTLSCKNPGSFTAQFTLTSPNAVQSATLSVSHSC